MSYKYFVERPWLDILLSQNCDLSRASNNHVLNSLLIKAGIGLFGNHDWVFRLHILASFAVAFYYCHKILGLMNPGKWRMALYMVLIFVNPYLLDFFAVARGYAMSIAGWSAATYYFMKYEEGFEPAALRKSMLALSLSIYSNFSALYFLVIFALGYCSVFVRHRKDSAWIKHALGLGAMFAVAALLMAVPLSRTLASHDVHGGYTSFFHDSVVTYAEGFLHYSPGMNKLAFWSEGTTNLEHYAFLLALFWCLLQVGGLACRANPAARRLHWWALSQCVAIVVLAELLFLLLHTPFPATRTTLLFGFPFLLSVAIAFERIYLRSKWAWLLVVPLVWFQLQHFRKASNLDNTYEWFMEGDAKELLAYLADPALRRTEGKPLRVGVENWRYPSIAYYGETQYRDRVEVVWMENLDSLPYDFVYLQKNMADTLRAMGFGLEKAFGHGDLFKKWTPAQAVPAQAQEPAQ